jgi:hypothetical protein
MDQQNGVPRVKPSDVEAVIDRTYYFTGAQGAMHEGARWVGNAHEDDAELGLVTICVVVLKNGFKIIGSSCCAHPAMFEASIGRDLAREDAIEQIWPILGYQLKDALHREAAERRAAGLFDNALGDEQ